MTSHPDSPDQDVSGALVFRPDPVGDGWPEIEEELTRAYRLTREAAISNRPIVYILETDHLLGRRGPGPAMVATGLLSAARTTAIELARSGVAVNVLAIEGSTEPTTIEAWVAVLVDTAGPTGEIVHIGSSHIGKALQ